MIPANLIRFPDRPARRPGDRGGPAPPSGRASTATARNAPKEFRDRSPQAPLIYVTITEAETPLDSTARLDDIYSRYFTGPPFPGRGISSAGAWMPDSALSRRDRLLRAARGGALRRPLPRRGDRGNPGDLHPRGRYRPRPDDALPLQPRLAGRLADMDEPAGALVASSRAAADALYSRSMSRMAIVKL